MRFTPTTLQCLIESGWRPEREADLSGYDQYVVAHPRLRISRARAFLKEFIGLQIRCGVRTSRKKLIIAPIMVGFDEEVQLNLARLVGEHVEPIRYSSHAIDIYIG